MLVHITIYAALSCLLISGLAIGENHSLDVPGAVGYILVITSVTLSLIYFFVTLWSNITITIRRLNDIGLNWLTLSLILIPYIGQIALVYCLTLPGINDEYSLDYFE